MTITETTNTNPTEISTPTDFVRKQGEAGSVLKTNDPRDFAPKVREDGTKLNARQDPRGEDGSEKRRAFEQLKESIRAEGGNLQPIGVEVVNSLARGRDPNLPRGWVIWGERRWAACCDLFAEGVPVQIKYITVSKDVDQTVAMALENLARYDLSQVEKSDFVKKLLAEGKTKEEVCRICGRSIGWVEAMILLSSDKVAPETREAAKNGDIPTDVALELARNVEPSQQGSAIKEIMAMGKTKADAKRAVGEITGKATTRPGKKQIDVLMERIEAADIPTKTKIDLVDVPTLLIAVLDWSTGRMNDKTFKTALQNVFGDAIDLKGVFGASSQFNKKANAPEKPEKSPSKKATGTKTSTSSKTPPARPGKPN